MRHFEGLDRDALRNSAEAMNAFLWFLMDAFWVMDWGSLSILMIVPALLSGLSLVGLERRPDYRLINVACFFWIVLNASWLASEKLHLPVLLVAARAAAGVSLIFISWAILTTRDIHEVLAHFSKVRLRRGLGFRILGSRQK